MKKTVYPFLLFVLIASCAKIGSPTGGPKDETPPVFVTANPPYESVNFKAKRIRIYFDELIVLRDLQKQLIISPPLKTPPIVSPQGMASRYINIKILDTLILNTTYTFNFGSAIQDNNEGNKLESFKYVFSTGDKIDSLTLKGSVKDAFNREQKKNVNLLLYEFNKKFNDSVIYKQKPRYLTKTLDSINFEFTNLKKGTYMLIALDEAHDNYLFNPKDDKIGFYSKIIELPNDSVIENPIVLFKEKMPYKFRRAREEFKGRITFGFLGERSNMKVKMISQKPKDFKSFSQFEKNKDTLNYWFTPFKADSLVFRITATGIDTTTTLRPRRKKIDSLKVISSASGVVGLNDSIFFNSNNPIIKTDTAKISFINKDSVDIKFDLKKIRNNEFALLFDKEENSSYTVSVFPKAFVDLYGTTNDTLVVPFTTKTKEDYGGINIKLITKKPTILQLLNEQEQVLRTEYFVKSGDKKFPLLNPGKYYIRAIIDENKNNKWDTGDFLKRIQPEKVIYFKNEIELRPNWIINETIIVE